jgi:hypothetical protein
MIVCRLVVIWRASADTLVPAASCARTFARCPASRTTGRSNVFLPSCRTRARPAVDMPETVPYWWVRDRMSRRPTMSLPPFVVPLSPTYEQPASAGGVPPNSSHAACWRVVYALALPKCGAQYSSRRASDIGRFALRAICTVRRYGSAHHTGGRIVPAAA